MTSIYAVAYTVAGNNFTTLVQTFPASSSGSVTASSSLTLPTGFSVFALEVDSTGQIYVSGSPNLNSGAEVLVYAAGAEGTATPVRTITFSTTGSDDIVDMAFDSRNDLWIARQAETGPFIEEVSPTANGTASPIATIAGSNTMIGGYGTVENPGLAEKLAFDSSDNLYVVTATGPALNSSTIASVLVFAPNSNGNVAPTRSISSTGVFFSGIAVDAANDIYIAQSPVSAGTPGSVVQEYSPTASGAATPLKTISFSSLNVLDIGSMRLDTTTNTFYAAAQATPVGVLVNNYILSFSSTADGTVTPIQITTSAAEDIAENGLAIH